MGLPFQPTTSMSISPSVPEKRPAEEEIQLEGPKRLRAISDTKDSLPFEGLDQAEIHQSSDPTIASDNLPSADGVVDQDAEVAGVGDTPQMIPPEDPARVENQRWPESFYSFCPNFSRETLEELLDDEDYCI